MTTNNMNNHTVRNPKISWWMSWPVIIISFFTMYLAPVGIFLLWKRVKIDKRAAFYARLALIIFGIGFILFAFLALLVSLSEGIDSMDVTMITLITLIGSGSLLLSRNIKKYVDEVKSYMSIIVNKGITSLDNIAPAMGKNYSEVSKDLKKMIDRGYFDGAYIDEEERELVLPNNHIDVKPEVIEKTPSDVVEMIVIPCKGCGANNKVQKGVGGECEYCGSPISGE